MDRILDFRFAGVVITGRSRLTLGVASRFPLKHNVDQKL